MEQLTIKDGNKNRSAEYFNCVFCGKKFLRAIKIQRAKKFCCRKCFSDNKTKESNFKCECFCCGKTITKKNSSKKNSKHGFYFCSRVCKEKSQSLKGNCPEIRPTHYGTAEISYRQMMMPEIKMGCSICKINETYATVVHHLDGNHLNNEKSNLEIVCWNCHLRRHLVEHNGTFSFCPTFLTPRNIVEELDKKYVEMLKNIK